MKVFESLTEALQQGYQVYARVPEGYRPYASARPLGARTGRGHPWWAIDVAYDLDDDILSLLPQPQRGLRRGAHVSRRPHPRQHDPDGSLGTQSR
jgi:hypothetical protein